jgi:hypothetical protein
MELQTYIELARCIALSLLYDFRFAGCHDVTDTELKVVRIFKPTLYYFAASISQIPSTKSSKL